MAAKKKTANAQLIEALEEQVDTLQDRNTELRGTVEYHEEQHRDDQQAITELCSLGEKLERRLEFKDGLIGGLQEELRTVYAALNALAQCLPTQVVLTDEDDEDDEDAWTDADEELEENEWDALLDDLDAVR